MSNRFLTHDRLADLLAQQAIEGLPPAEQGELTELLQAFPEADGEALEKVVAAVFLAGDWQEDSLPVDVRARLEAGAAKYSSTAPLEASPVGRSRWATGVPSDRASSAAGLAWFAAAAAIVIAVVAWAPRLQSLREAPVDLLTQASLDLETLAEIRQKFVATADPLLRAWTPTQDPAGQGVTGDVVWDTGSQTGYLRFAGLPVNDAQQLQYQLWIFDATRDEKYPVDGGVFNVPAGATEVVVPILAKLPVRDPTLFAVTVEKPGGAVVSTRERIVLVAPVRAG